MNAVVFELDGGLFALRAECVREVIDPLPITPLPFVPPEIEGLVSHAGRVIPQIDLAALLGRSKADANDSGVLLVVDLRSTRYALRIGRVLGMSAVDESAVREVDVAEASGAGGAQRLAGAFRWQDQTALLLEDARLGLADVAPVGVPDGTQTPLGEAEARDDGDAAAETPLACLVIASGSERYALPLDRVMEVVELSELTELPHAPSEVVGMMWLRGCPYLALSVSTLLDRRHSANNAVMVIIEHSGARVGLAVERVLGIEKFGDDALHPTEEDGGEVIGYLMGTHGEMIGLLEIDHLLSQARFERLRSHLARQDDARSERTAPIETRSYLSCVVGPERCAIALDRVRHVMEYADVVDLTEGHSSVLDGMIQIRGEVVPVSDLRVKMGFEPRLTPYTALIAVDVGGRDWALVVDRVLRVVEVPVSSVESARGETPGFIEAVARVDDTLYSVLGLQPLAAAARPASQTVDAR